MRSVVLLRGSVEGMGRAGWCEMLAMKEYVSPTAAPIYSHCCVLDAPADLPDGDYKATFAGHTVSAHKEDGLWLPADDAVPVRGGTERSDRRETNAPAVFLELLRKHSA